MTIDFDEAVHSYRLNGRVVPSVTQVLKLAGVVDDEWYDDASCLRGTYVHEATEMFDKGELDEETLDPVIVPYLGAWKAFLRESKAEIIDIEKRVVNEVYRYAGTLDRIAIVAKRLTVIDIKTGSPEPSHQLQTAGYARCLPESVQRLAVYLRDDGTYKSVEHADFGDAHVFLAAVAVANWKLGHGWKL
jgi:hypothetical protein